MVRSRASVLSFLLALLAGLCPAYPVWKLSSAALVRFEGGVSGSMWLSSNTGAHAVAMQEYPVSGAYQTWVTVVARHNFLDKNIQAAEYERLRESLLPEIADISPDENNYWSHSASIAMNATKKHVAWGRFPQVGTVDAMRACTLLTTIADGWPQSNVTEDGHDCYQQQVTVATQRYDDDEYVYVAYLDSFYENSQSYLRLVCARSTDNGTNWDIGEPISSWAHDPNYPSSNPTLAVQQGGTDVYLACQCHEEVWFYGSTNNGATWSAGSVLDEGGVYPCIAANGSLVFACWGDGLIGYRWSTNGGATWTPALDEDPFEMDDLDYPCRGPNVSLVRTVTGTGVRDNLVVVFNACKPDQQEGSTNGVVHRWATFMPQITDPIAWSSPLWLTSNPAADTWWRYFPSGAAYTCPRSSGDPDADTATFVVWNAPGSPYLRVHRVIGRWGYPWNRLPPPIAVDGGRRLRQSEDGLLYHAGLVQGHVVSGPVCGDLPIPLLVSAGRSPALALDGEGKRWTAFVDSDTLWCLLAEDTVKAIFCGSSSARPGQPSIEVYPNKANGVYVGAIAFAVYDSSGGGSSIYMVKVDTGHVLLDTIESVSNLGDSCPSINIAYGDSIYVTWNSGDIIRNY